VTVSGDTPVRFYRCTDPSRLVLPTDEAANIRVRLWRPGDTPPGPYNFIGRAHLAYLGFHRLGVFANRDYSALFIDDAAGRTLHVSYIFPRFFRFPFMTADDLQVGSTHTEPDARGRGLARRALVEAARRLAHPGRRFWYLTEASNAASCTVAEKAGFDLVGIGRRIPRLGIGALSAYRMIEPITPRTDTDHPGTPADPQADFSLPGKDFR
jgi:GNAT superfamily N-acetyltransferase